MAGPTRSRLKVAVLAVTGMVGLRCVSMRSSHPFFRVAAVTGESGVGKRSGEVVSASSLPISGEARSLAVRTTKADVLDDVDLVFSPLPTDAAGTLGPELAEERYNVIADATSHVVDPGRVAEVLAGFRVEPQRLRFPTAPADPVIVTREEGKPQPELDRSAGTVPGMSVTVGRIRKSSTLNQGDWPCRHTTQSGAGLNRLS